MSTSFSIVARGGHPDFLDLPWGQPLGEWDHPRMVKMAHGLSRHVVRFVRYDDRVYALKETEEQLARREYDVLRYLRDERLPVVEPVGIVSATSPAKSMLITRYLDFSLPYWYLLGRDEPALADKLLNAGVRIKPILIEEGHHARELRRRTGLEVQENQAQRLLADIESHRAWMEADAGRPVPAAVAAARWLADIYEPLVESVPDDLLARLEPAEVFHHLLEHRYYLSQRAGTEVSHTESLADYLETILARQPTERQLSVDSPDVELG